jgi:hypothetical protein
MLFKESLIFKKDFIILLTDFNSNKFKEVCFFAIGFWVNWQPGVLIPNESLCNTDSNDILLNPIELIV